MSHLCYKKNGKFLVLFHSKNGQQEYVKPPQMCTAELAGSSENCAAPPHALVLIPQG